ncbi:MAG: hypothetical protein NC117_03920 [Pseudoflavonifractor sp.]|nr:hypothetical protein [Pseudoflavonifractor sp.]
MRAAPPPCSARRARHNVLHPAERLIDLSEAVGGGGTTEPHASLWPDGLRSWWGYN